MFHLVTDILKEMSYNPKMGEQFGYVMSTSTRWRFDKGGDLVYVLLSSVIILPLINIEQVCSHLSRWIHSSGSYPDENYGKQNSISIGYSHLIGLLTQYLHVLLVSKAREIMQLYTIGLHYLNDDGTEVVDKFGRVVQTYSNNDILSNSRIWSGFEYTGKICFRVPR